MKNKTRKVLTTCTALAMTAIFGLTGCGAKTSQPSASSAPASSEASKAEESKAETEAEQPEELDAVELSWILRIPDQNDKAEVLDAVNNIIQPEINATLDIQFIDPAAYAEKTKLKITSEEPFDLMFTSAGYGFYEYASKGAFVPLEDLLPKYAPKTWEMIPESFWDAVTVDGHIYAIPNYQIVARQGAITINKEIVEKYDIDMSNVKTFEDMEPILAMLQEKEPDLQYITGGMIPSYFEAMSYMGLEGIGQDGSPGVIEIDGSDYTVVNQYEHPAYVNFCKLIKDFEQKGYINRDEALLDDKTELVKNGEFPVALGANWKPGAAQEALARYGHEPVPQMITEPYVNTTSILGTLQAVSVTSKNPERALMFLDMVNSNADLYNTLVYGIEDKHYKMIGENRIEVIADSGYATNVPWMIGNTFNGYLKGDTADTVYEETIALNESAKASRILGFQFDPEPVKAEIAQCQTIYDKYVPKGLAFGVYDDVEGTLEKMNKELVAAGMEKVIAEKQAQLDAWAAGK